MAVTPIAQGVPWLPQVAISDKTAIAAVTTISRRSVRLGDEHKIVGTLRVP